MGAPPDKLHLADALQVAAKVLAYIQLQSLEEASVKITLPQYRLLVVLDEAGPVRSGYVADTIGVDASTVTRNCDQLATLGLVERGNDPAHRNAVMLGLTAKGRAFIAEVREKRRDELMRLVDRLPVTDREAVIRGIYLLAGTTLADEGGEVIPPHLTLF